MNDKIMNDGMPLIQVKNLYKKFDQKSVLKNITVDINEGDVVCVIGPSGSGKSTFLRCLNRLEEPSGGHILFDGADICDPRTDIDLHRQKMGMVFQQFNLFPHMTILKNLTVAPMSLQKKSQEEAEGYAMQLLERVGLQDRAADYPSQLSGGQQQRIAIVRALCMKPEVMLFDEPTSALDPELVGEVLASIRKVAKTGITMIVVTHEIAFAKEAASRVIFMEGGVVVEDGAPEQVINHPRTERARQFLTRINAETLMAAEA